MPRETATAELWTDYPSAGGTRKGAIPIVSGSVTNAIGGDSKLSASVPRARWLALAGALRDVVRIGWPDGTVEQFRIRRLVDTIDQRVVAFDALTVFDDLVTGGPILRVVNGTVVTRLAAEVSLATWLTSYILPHESAQRIGLSLGTLARNPTIPGEFDAKSPGAVIRTLFEAAGLEVEIVPAGDAGWVLNGPLAIGDGAPTLMVERGRTQIDLTSAVDDKELAQVVVPLGVADADTGDRATIANVRYEVSALPGSGWVSLVDPETSTTPILLDQQWVGAALRLPDLSTRAITNARASDGSVQIASTTGLTVGMRIGLVAADGSPLVEVFDTGGGSAPRIVPKTWSTLRGEANELTNGRFASGLTGWSAANAVTPPAYAEVYRSELGITRAFQANGTRAAGTATGTAFNVDGLPAGSRVLRGDVIDQAGSTHALSAAAIPSPTGALTLSLATGLPAAYTDNEPITLVRRELASLTLVGTTPIAGALFLLSGAADVLDRIASLPVTSRAIIGPGGETYAITRLARRSATTALLNVSGWSGGTGITVTGQRVVSNLSVVSAQRLRVRFQLESLISIGNTGIVDTYCNFGLYGAYLPGIPDDILNNTGGYTISGVVVASGVESGENYIDIDVLGLPSGATFVGGSLGSIQPVGTVTYTSGGTAPRSLVLFSSTTLANGATFSVVHTRERRTLRFDGAASSGATTVAFKAISALARRDWTNTDTLYNERAPQLMTVRFTAINLGALTLTIDLANSTAQNFQDLWPTTVFQLNGTFERDGDFYSTLNIQLVSIASTTVTFTTLESFVFSGSSVPTPATIAASSASVTDSYAVTGAASWASTGLATVPISIPSGRTLYAGAKVWSNFHGSGPSDTYMIVATTVVGPASSVSVRASDGYPSDWDGVTAAPNALWRAGTDSYLEVLGNVLVVAATATVNGSGQAALTLTAPNPNAVPDNVALSFTRPALLRPSDPTTGSVVWLLKAPGGVTSTTPGLGSTPVLIPVTPGTSKVVTALVTFSLPAGVYPVGEQPAVAIVDAAGNILTTAPLATNQVTVLSTPTVARIILQVTLTASTSLGVRLYGGATDPRLRAACLDAMLCVTARDDVPFIASSWANQLAQRGIDVLAANRLPIAEVELDLATLRRWSDAAATGAPIVLGQKVRVASLGITRRILTVARSLTNPARSKVTVGAMSTDLTRRVAATAGG